MNYVVKETVILGKNRKYCSLKMQRNNKIQMECLPEKHREMHSKLLKNGIKIGIWVLYYSMSNKITGV
jgi:hypothetical protein